MIRSSVEQELKDQGVYLSTTAGMSMYPMLRDREDVIVVERVSGRLKKYDVPLYRRRGSYVLHRIIRVVPDGYVICGDNCAKFERDITDHEIIGVLKGFYRDGRYIDCQNPGYRLYAWTWGKLSYFRAAKRKIKGPIRLIRRQFRDRDAKR